MRTRSGTQAFAIVFSALVTVMSSGGCAADVPAADMVVLRPPLGKERGETAEKRLDVSDAPRNTVCESIIAPLQGRGTDGGKPRSPRHNPWSHARRDDEPQ